MLKKKINYFFDAMTSDSLFLSLFIYSDDRKLQAQCETGEFWVIFGGFTPIGKKVSSDDDIVIKKTAPNTPLKYLLVLIYSVSYNMFIIFPCKMLV